MSPTSRYHSTNNSCYSTPLNSPPKIGGLPLPANQLPNVQLSPFAADPGFVERAVKFSCFSGRNYGCLSGQFGLPETGKLSRVSSSQSLKGAQMAVSENGMEVPPFDPAQLNMVMRAKFGSRASGVSTGEELELGNGQEVLSIANRMTAVGGENYGRKRKGAPKGKGKEAALSSSAANVAKTVEEENSDSKRSKSVESIGGDKNAVVKPKTEHNGESGEKQGKDNNAKPPEPPKDYIHVRARRGQATDSHSLAERVRREKISERMKFLQDLVPSCNKVTGKAVMLDEIINYVQSLQRQVEFLSMKLATVNPRPDFYVENMLPKDNHQASMSMPHPHQPVYPIDVTSSAFQYPHQPQGTPLQSAVNTAGLEPHNSLNPLESSSQRSSSVQLPGLDVFADTASQLGNFWENDLQSVIQMGFGQNQENAFSSQIFHGN